jgi:hypothetical protein
MQYVKMLESRKGSNDGIEVRLYEKDGEYLVSDELAEIFVGQGSAETADAPPEEPETDDVDEDTDGDGDEGDEASAKPKPKPKPKAKPRAKK